MQLGSPQAIASCAAIGFGGLGAPRVIGARYQSASVAKRTM
jgi:hypothetical protein